MLGGLFFRGHAGSCEHLSGYVAYRERFAQQRGDRGKSPAPRWSPPAPTPSHHRSAVDWWPYTVAETESTADGLLSSPLPPSFCADRIIFTAEGRAVPDQEFRRFRYGHARFRARQARGGDERPLLADRQRVRRGDDHPVDHGRGFDLVAPRTAARTPRSASGFPVPSPWSFPRRSSRRAGSIPPGHPPPRQNRPIRP